MNEPFDPYHKWLGIPPQDQPPHYYRLLGIELFESDPDVISNAVDGRMAQIKCFQTGQYSAVSQRLLNELALAKVCLLNPKKRPLYDEQLRKQLAARPSAKSHIPSGEGQGEGVVEEDEFVRQLPQLQTTSSTLYRAGGKARASNRLVGAILGVCMAAAILVVYLLASREQASSPARQPTIAKTLPQATQPAKSAKSDDAKKSRDTAKTASPTPAVESPLPEAERKPETATAGNASQEPVLPLELREDAASNENGTVPFAPDVKQSGEPKKPAVPDATQQQAAAKIREVFAKEFAASQSVDQKIGLAAKLVEQAKQNAEDPVTLFVLLRMAAETAASAGELVEALAAVDEIEQSFDISAPGMKADMVSKAVEAGRASGWKLANRQGLLSAAMGLADEAVLADDFDGALRLGKLAAVVARASKEPQAIRDAAARTRDIERLKLRFATIKKAIDALAEDPNNAEANLSVGQWYCFTKGDWEKGLPLLAKSPRPPGEGQGEGIAAIADRDLAQPSDPKARTALADAWWELAESEQGPSKSIVQRRAAHWYEQALPKLSGLDKAKAQKRIEAVATEESREGAAGSKVRGVVQRGNVALASNGATVSDIPEHPEQLLDGNTTAYNMTSGVAIAVIGQPFTVTLRQVYQLREIRVLLWDFRPQSYNYVIATSVDGKGYTPVADHSQGAWTGWQHASFSPRPVKYIRVYPIRRLLLDENGADSKRFTIVELEAYCIPPGNR